MRAEVPEPAGLLSLAREERLARCVFAVRAGEKVQSTGGVLV